jgi:two-component system, cell cycle response regulator
MLHTLPQFQISDTKPGAERDPSIRDDRQSCLVRIYPAGVSGSLIPLNYRRTTIGREQLCTIEINDDFMSRTHAILELTDSGYMLTDNHSRNGTFVNDQRITSHLLRPGDQIRVGNHIFKFLSADHVEALYHEAVYEMMTIDALTGIYNRRYFEDAFRREVLRSQRHGRSLALLMFDIDLFKSINDAHGHLVGDEILKALCSRIRSRIRGDEIVARVGGEEFAVVLVETTRDNARKIAETLCDLIAASPLLPHDPDLRVTISIGGTFTHGLEAITDQDMIARADQQMYLAKAAGRNCVRFE